MATVQATPVGIQQSPMLMQDPNYVLQMLEAQRRAKLADALAGQGMAPIDYDHAGRISPLQGVAKLAEALMGTQGMKQSNIVQANLLSQGVNNQLAALGGGQAQPPQGGMPPPSGAPAVPSAPGAPAPAVAPPQPGIAGGVAPNANNPFGLPPMLVLRAQQGDPAAQEQIKTLLANATMTPEQRNARDSLIGPQIQANLATQNLTPEQRNLQSPELRAGVIQQQARQGLTDTEKLQLARAQVPDGSPQAAQIDAAIAKANYVAPAEVKAGNFALDAQNRPVFYNPGMDKGILPTGLATTPQGVTMPTGATQGPGYAGANASIAGAEQGARQANTIFSGVVGPDGKPVTNFGGKIAGMVGQNPQQGTAMNEDFKNIAGQAAEARNTISYLNQIKQLAPLADTGQFSDKQQYVNSLLSMAGSERATDAVTAKSLLDKYHNQIVARLGQGGLGTDAARAIIGAAYPNSHMPAPAIMEAADNAIGAQQQTIGKLQALTPHFLNGDPAAFYGTKQQYESTADPTIYQWKNMPKGPARDQFAQQRMAADPTWAARAKALQGMGVQ